MDQGSDFKHFAVGSVLDVVLFVDMHDGRGLKRLICVPIPFCYHRVTTSMSLVLVIRSLLLCLRRTSTPLPSFWLTSIDLYGSPWEYGARPFPRCSLCVSVTYCGDNFFYIKKKKTILWTFRWLNILQDMSYL